MFADAAVRSRYKEKGTGNNQRGLCKFADEWKDSKLCSNLKMTTVECTNLKFLCKKGRISCYCL